VEVAVTGAVPISEAIEVAGQAWSTRSQQGDLSEASSDRYRQVLNFFGRYCNTLGVTDVQELDRAVCHRWVEAPVSAASPGSRGRAGAPASTGTRRFRLTVLNQAIGVWADHGWIDRHLLHGVHVDQVPQRVPCPLTPAEVQVLRHTGRRSSVDTLSPVVVDLALVGLAHTEIGRLTVADVDTETGSLLVAAGRSRAVPARTLQLDASGLRAMRAHIAALRPVHRKTGATPTFGQLPLAQYPSARFLRGTIQPTSVGQKLYQALRLSTITRPGVTPSSLQDFAANRCYALTNRVEDVAQLLGLASLDNALRTIDPQWQATFGDTIRGHQD
jgi:site-specific recombinase XerD